MSRLLLIETATDVCSTAVASDGVCMATSTQPACPQHAAVLPFQVRTCLSNAGWNMADLEGVAVSGGPGSYTTLRTGISFAKGLCYALRIPLYSISTLEALAWQCRTLFSDRPALYMPMLDARRDEVWAAIYDQELRCIHPAAPVILDSVGLGHFLGHPSSPLSVYCCGNGVPKIPEVLRTSYPLVPVPLACSAEWLAPIAEEKAHKGTAENLISYMPFYMKDPNITNFVKFS